MPPWRAVHRRRRRRNRRKRSRMSSRQPKANRKTGELLEYSKFAKIQLLSIDHNVRCQLKIKISLFDFSWEIVSQRKTYVVSSNYIFKGIVGPARSSSRTSHCSGGDLQKHKLGLLLENSNFLGGLSSNCREIWSFTRTKSQMPAERMINSDALFMLSCCGPFSGGKTAKPSENA